MEPSNPRELTWDSERFRDIDGSPTTVARQMIRALAAVFTAFWASTVVSDRVAGSLDGAARFFVSGALFTVLGCLFLFVVSARPISRAITEQRQVIASHEAILRERTRRQEFIADVQDAFDMASDEEGAIQVVEHALAQVWDSSGEFLLSDSSRAHLRRVAVSPVAPAPNCSVSSPWDCPAVRRGHAMRFADSGLLSTCPRLRDRGACSAICIPVTVLGTPMGVLHLTGAPSALPTPEQVGALEALATQAGSRLGVLRAISQSQLQASTDPLTGLLNRRSLEAELAGLRSHRRSYALVLADLDHFKDLNDTYGHETGDRALRLFARVLRQTVRGDDIVCRYGGEEFVVVFPEVDIRTAALSIDRVRLNLVEALANGEVPPFTASYGLADAGHGTDSIDVIRAADLAMFRAKQGGRDRVAVSSGAPWQIPPLSPSMADEIASETLAQS